MHQSPFAPMGSPRKNQEEESELSGLNFLERKGDITFYSDSKGKLFQQLGCDNPFKVKDGKIAYKTMLTAESGVVIKYQTNGVNGFSLFKKGKLLEDNIWKFNDAVRIANEI